MQRARAHAGTPPDQGRVYTLVRDELARRTPRDFASEAGPHAQLLSTLQSQRAIPNFARFVATLDQLFASAAFVGRPGDARAFVVALHEAAHAALAPRTERLCHDCDRRSRLLRRIRKFEASELAGVSQGVLDAVRPAARADDGADALLAAFVHGKVFACWVHWRDTLRNL
jgi:hypothetical protein